MESYGPWALANLDRQARIEETWLDAASGDTLVHGDIRGDNVLLHHGEALAVD
jgi:hypothetical protein